MRGYNGFKTNPVPASGYECYANEGMHDPPRPGRRYSQVLGRRVFEAGFSQNGFLVQVDLLDVPDFGERAAVFLRSKDFPKGKNTANATFKFRRDDSDRHFVIDFKAERVKNLVAAQSSIPGYLTPCPLRAGRLLLPGHLGKELVHLLLLATDFAGQAANGMVVPRDPNRFYAPI